MSDTTCHVITDCAGTPRYAYSSSEATCAGGAGATVGADAETPHTNCPSGFIWGGLNCIVDEGAQSECSEGYKWSGTGCVGDDEDCATGFYDNAGVCTACPALPAPTVTCSAYMTADITCPNPYGVAGNVRIHLIHNDIEQTDLIATAGGPINASVVFFDWYLGIELCVYYEVIPTAPSAYDGCATQSSPATCILMSVTGP